MNNNLGLFPVTQRCIYLNHAALSPWPSPASEAVTAFAHDNTANGSLNYPQWMNTEQRLRERAARLINAPDAGDIALVKNTSEGISFVAQGLDWKPGENVVGIRQEFPSNRFAWMALNERGVDFRTLDLTATTREPEESLIALCDENTRVLAISSVQFSNGLALDLEKLGAFCRRSNILFCVDAIQQIGVLPFDVQACCADFVIADGHKWMLGPEGIGIFYVRREVLDTLRLTQFGWHMAEKMGDYEVEGFQPASNSRRFEAGSPNMLGIHALEASLGLIEKIGINTIDQQVRERIALLFSGLHDLPGVQLLSHRENHRRSGMVTFTLSHGKTDELFEHLKQHNVFCALRGGGIRLSPHFYTPIEQLETTLKLVAEFQKL